jgi:hypothetical protein
MDIITSYQALKRPPKLRGDGTGYDWRELDRWFRQLHLLLGAFVDGSQTINLFTGHISNVSGIEDVEAKVDMIAVNEQSTRDNKKDIEDVTTLTNMGE